MLPCRGRAAVKLLLGMLIVLGCVAGGFVIARGNLLALWHPPELLIIGGAAFGAFVIANSGSTIRATFSSLGRLLRGSRASRQTALDLLGLLHELFNKARRQGLMTLESDIEDPGASALFQRYPRVLGHARLVEFITDYVRLMLGGSTDALELENLMDVELETHHQEASKAADALAAVSDGLPGFGIVAAVLGVVITMGSIGGPVEELGEKVAAALVGTFLGILLAYGIVGPMAAYLRDTVDDEEKLYECVKVSMLAMLNGSAPMVAVEFGRKVLYTHQRPGFQELEDFIRGSGA